jgi:hypothetical protein
MKRIHDPLHDFDMANNDIPSDTSRLTNYPTSIPASGRSGTSRCIVLWPAVIEFVLRRRGGRASFGQILRDINIKVDVRCLQKSWAQIVLDMLHDDPSFRLECNNSWCLSASLEPRR